jgi:hypothetical protein
MSFIFMFPVLSLAASEANFLQNWWSIIKQKCGWIAIPWTIGFCILIHVLRVKERFKTPHKLDISSKSGEQPLETTP